MSVTGPQIAVRIQASAGFGPVLSACVRRAQAPALAILLLAALPFTAAAEDLARLTGEPGAERIVTDSTPPARARNPESGLPRLTPAKPLDRDAELPRPVIPAGSADPRIVTGDAAGRRDPGARLPEELWTALAVLAALSALGVAAWVGARLSHLGAASPSVRAPIASTTANRPLATHHQTADAQIRRALERARRAIALDDVLPPRAAHSEQNSDAIDPARLVLEISPERRRAKALALAHAHGVISRPVRPLGFSYAAVRRARFGERTGPSRSQDARSLARAIGSVSVLDVAAPASAGPEEKALMRRDVAPEGAGAGDKGDRISNVIRGIAAFDARHRGSPRERR